MSEIQKEYQVPSYERQMFRLFDLQKKNAEKLEEADITRRAKEFISGPETVDLFQGSQETVMLSRSYSADGNKTYPEIVFMLRQSTEHGLIAHPIKIQLGEIDHENDEWKPNASFTLTDLQLTNDLLAEMENAQLAGFIPHAADDYLSISGDPVAAI